MALRADSGPSRRVFVVSVVLVAASVSLFVLIAEDVLDGGGLISHDQAVLTWFVDVRTDWLTTAAKTLSAIGSFWSLFVIGVVVAIWERRRSWPWPLAVAPVSALIVGGLTASLAKAVFDRPRPPASAHASFVSTAAFPSVHATDAAAFFLAASFTIALTVAHRQWVQAVLVASGSLIAILIGVSRLVLGVHWLSDVVAGWALGTAIATTVLTTLWYAAARRSVRLRPGNPDP
jgi:undecaprenyl-diphosphatase